MGPCGWPVGHHTIIMFHTTVGVCTAYFVFISYMRISRAVTSTFGTWSNQHGTNPVLACLHSPPPPPPGSPAFFAPSKFRCRGVQPQGPTLVTLLHIGIKIVPHLQELDPIWVLCEMQKGLYTNCAGCVQDTNWIGYSVCVHPVLMGVEGRWYGFWRLGERGLAMYERSYI